MTLYWQSILHLIHLVPRRPRPGTRSTPQILLFLPPESRSSPKTRSSRRRPHVVPTPGTTSNRGRPASPLPSGGRPRDTSTSTTPTSSLANLVNDRVIHRPIHRQAETHP